MERLYDLNFDLSNEDRFSILYMLVERPMKLTGLSKEIGVTHQQCARHLNRLVKTGLVVKDPEGFYCLAPYGELTLRQYRGQLFTAKHRDYFNKHLLTDIPDSFVSRLGELSNSTYIDDVMAVFKNIERLFMEAEEYVWRITDSYLMMVVPSCVAATEKGVELRLIEPKNIAYPPDGDERDFFEKAWRKGLFLNRILEKVDVFLAMSEREVATISFPTMDGRFDYHGFTSTDVQMREWCSDLFEYYWGKAEPLRDFAKRAS